MTTQQLDEERKEAFGAMMVDILNSGATNLMISIGHQTGLFETMSKLPPSTSSVVAEKAGLNERYVREWLKALTVARVIDYDRTTQTYVLPPEHAAWLTSAAGPDNLAVQSQFFALLGTVEQQVVKAFREGGGVPYSAFDRFQKLMAEDSAGVHDVALVDRILPLVPGLVERLAAGIDVLDVGCGSGHAVNLMAEAFPASRFAGYDISEEGIETGRREAAAKGLTNVRFEVRDVASLGEPGSYDFITAFDAIHDQAQPAAVLAGIAEALRPGGAFLMVDIRSSSEVADNLDLPLAPLLYTISTMHCMTVSLAYGGAGLGTMWGEQLARQMLAEAGFGHVEVKELEDDFVNSYYVCTR